MMLGALLALGVGAVTATVGQGVLSNYVAPAAETAAWTSDPESGSKVDALDMVTVTFTDFTPAAYGEGSFKATWNGESCAYTYYNMRGKTVYFDVPRGSSYPSGDGVLVLEGTEGYFINSAGQPSPAFSITLYVGDVQQTKEFAWEGIPADGSTVKDVTEFSITFPGFQEVKISDDAGLTVKFNGETDATFMIKNVNGNTVNFGRGRTTGENVDMSGEGTLSATFDAGSFILDGSVVSPEFTYTITQDPNYVAPSNTFANLIDGSDPAVGTFVFDRVLGEFSFKMKEDVAVNTTCESPINLKLNGTVIGSVQPADDEAVQVFDGNIVNLNFGIDETTAGMYSIEIPEGAFTASAGDALLASTLQYFNGVGTFTPAPGEVSVASAKWSSIKLTPFSGVEINENTTIGGEDEGDGVVAGTSDKAKLMCGDEVIAQWGIDQLVLYKGAYTFSFTGIDRDGEYVMSFPKNFFMAGEGENETYSEPFEIKYTVVDGKSGPEQVYTVSPDSGSFPVFPAITLTYTGCQNISVKDGAKASMIVGSTSTEVVLTFTITAEGNKVTLTPDEEYTKYVQNFFTKYIVTVPAGSYDLTYDGTAYANHEVVVNTLRVSAPTAPAVTSDPAADSVVESLNTLTFHCPLDVLYSQASLYKPKLYSVLNGRRGSQLATYSFAILDDKSGFTITLASEVDFTPDAQYEVVLPAGLYGVTIDGIRANSLEQSFRYTIKGLPEFAWVGDPADGSTVQDVNNFTITFPGFETVKIDENCSYNVTWNGEDQTANTVVKTTEGNVVTFGRARTAEGGDLTGEGTMIVTFGSGIFVLDGVLASPEFTYTLTQDPEVVVVPAETFGSYISGSDPEINAFSYDKILGAFAFMMSSDEVAVDTSVEAPINLLLNGKMIGSVQPADDEAVQVFDGNIVSIDFGIEEQSEGIYTLEIPEGAFTVAGNALGADKLTYYVGVGTFDPAPGDVSVAEKGWSLINLTPFKGVSVYEITTSTEITPGTEETAKLTCGDNVIAEFGINQMTLYRGKYTMRFPEAIDRNGEYTLSFPEHFFMVGDEENPSLSEAFEVKYTITDGKEEPAQTYEVTPEAGNYAVFPTITLTYDDCESIEVVEGAKAELHVARAAAVSLTFTISAEGNVVTLTPDEDYTKYAGSPYSVYQVVVPAGSYKLTYDGTAWANKEVLLEQFKIKAPEAPLPVADPADGSTVEDLNLITCTFPIAMAGNSFTLYSPKLYPVVDGVRGAQIVAYKCTPNTEKTAFTMEPKSTIELADGDYEIVIPKSAYRFMIDGTSITNTEVVLHYTVKANLVGVAGMFAEDGNVTVYTMTGLCVLKNAPADELKNLSKGLYIVNGRKIVIR